MIEAGKEFSYADADDLDPFAALAGVEDDEDDLGVDGLALLGIKPYDKISKKANSAQPFSDSNMEERKK